jgi:molybdenum cofactor biosynthesis protein A
VPREISKGLLRSKQVLVDSYGRHITYLRLAITDRCNLRCNYCMPAEGIQLIPRHDILSFDELERIVAIFAQLGITKIRITGGEPFARKDAIQFLKQIRRLPYPLKLFITTNGVLAAPYFSELKSINPDGINLSLDTLLSDRFYKITRRNSFDQLERFLEDILLSKIPLKINTVVQPGINENEIIAISKLAKDHPVEVRFIEQMPFNGASNKNNNFFSGKEIENHLRANYLQMKKVESPDNSTSQIFQIKGFRGVIGIISGYSRTFCSSCNRIRVTPQGNVKTCLYDQSSLNLKLLLRTGNTDEQIKVELIKAVINRYEDGILAEQQNGQKVHNSMSVIGG